jgi:hypothetical protein
MTEIIKIGEECARPPGPDSWQAGLEGLLILSVSCQACGRVPADPNLIKCWTQSNPDLHPLAMYHQILYHQRLINFGTGYRTVLIFVRYCSF